MAERQPDIEHAANAFLPEVLSPGASGWWDSGQIDATRIQVLAQRIAAEGVTFTPTLATLRAMLTPQEEADLPNRPDARFLPAQQIGNWQSRGPWAPASLVPGRFRTRDG
ncbi:MAG: hypothetical protein ACE5HP_02250 [Gemmatimonadota bacterium]